MRTEATGLSVAPNQRTGNYEMDVLRDCSLLGMGYDAERQSGSGSTLLCFGRSALGRILSNFSILDVVSQWLA